MKRLYVLSKDIWRFNGFSFSIVICIFNCINQNLRDYKTMYITGMNGITSFNIWMFESKFDTQKIQWLGHRKNQAKTEDGFVLCMLGCRGT